MTPRGGLGFTVVDSHHHFVDVDRFTYYWMAAVPETLHRSFGPQELQTGAGEIRHRLHGGGAVPPIHR